MTPRLLAEGFGEPWPRLIACFQFQPQMNALAAEGGSALERGTVAAPFCTFARVRGQADERRQVRRGTPAHIRRGTIGSISSVQVLPVEGDR